MMRDRRTTPLPRSSGGPRPGCVHRRRGFGTGSSATLTEPAGALLATVTCGPAFTRLGAGQGLAFLAVAVTGIGFAVAVLRGARLAMATATVLLGGQLGGVIGTAWEPTGGIAIRRLRLGSPEPEWRVPVGDQQERVGLHTKSPPADTHHVVEQRPRIASGEQDGEPRDDPDHDPAEP
jgi:hypothetical protein